MADLNENKNLQAEKASDKPTEVAPKTAPVAPVPPVQTKPVNVTSTPKAKEVSVMTDPEGTFEYAGCQVHVVEAGETLFSIAQKYVVAIQQLRYFNHIDHENPKIKIGQKLVIPNKPIMVPYGK